MILSELTAIAENLWGSDVQIFDTKVPGIVDVSTARHGGYLVDTNLHTKLAKYGAKTYKSHIKAFEEDYEALKVLWVYPQLLRDPEHADEWLNKETVIRYDGNDRFLKDFPQRNILIGQEEEEENER